MNEKFQNALKRVPQECPPIWFMRQAGRYHSHYQKLKEKHSFVELCKQPELAAETAMGPIEEFDFDISILFSDLLFPLEAMGMGLEYNPGPILDRKLDHENVKQIKPVSEALPMLEFQRDAVKATRERLPDSKSLIGFVGGQWTLYTYAVEGSHKALMTFVKRDPKLFKTFCETLTPLLIENIKLQLGGGAELVMVLDTAGGEVSPWLYDQYVLPELKKLFAAYPGRLGYYSQRTTGDHLKLLWQQTEVAGFGYDHRYNIGEVLKSQPQGFVQGNFDQTMLFAETDVFKEYLREFIAPLKDMSPEERAGWVCGVGHGVLPKTPEKNVHLFIETVRGEFNG